MTQIFTNPSALEETTYGVELSKKQISEAKRLKRQLNDWQKQNQSKIVAYVGRFGSGKSATLRQVEVLYDQSKAKKKPLFLNFEAWRYADRTKLWDGFVLEIARQVGGDKKLNKTSDEIDGLSGVGRYVYKHPLQIALAVSAVWAIASALIWFILFDKSNTEALFIKDLLKYAAPILLGLLAIAGVTTLFRTRSSPLSRVEELEGILGRSLKGFKRPLIIVAEDIDRVGDEGVIFLETLRSFLNEQGESLKYPIIIVAPQDVTYMSVLNEDKIKGLERSVKIYDSVVYYGSSLLNISDVGTLLVNAGLKDDQLDRTLDTLKWLNKSFPGQFSMRLIKSIMREVKSFVEATGASDVGLATFYIAIRYVKVMKDGNPHIALNRLRTLGSRVSTRISNQDMSSTKAVLQYLAGVERSQSDDCRIEYGESDHIAGTEVVNKHGNVTHIQINIPSVYEQLLS